MGSFRRGLSPAIVVALICVAASATAQSFRAAHKPLKPEFFGINGVGYLHYRDDKNATRTADRKMSAVKRIGAGTDRTDFWWSLIEPEKGVFDWWRTDWLIDYYVRNKVEPFPILSYNAKWMGDTSPHTEEDFTAYADWVTTTVARYKDRVRFWEIWNEPNIPTFWKPAPSVDHYTEILKRGYRAAKEVDPTCTIVGAATSMTDVNFLMEIAKRGGINSMDVVSFHPYSHSDGPIQMHLARQIQNVRTVMARNGRSDIPLWITEMGWQADIRKPADVEKQANYLVQSHVIAAAENVERLYWFNLQDWDEGGKLEGWGLITTKFEEKRSFKAYRVMRDKLLDATFSRYDLLQDRMGNSFHAYQFEKNNQRLVVAWADRKKEARVEIPHATITDIYGAETGSDTGETSITEMPIYIDGGLMKFLSNRAPEVPQNLVVNPSFEDVETTRVYGWDRGFFAGGHSDGEFGIVEEGAAAGNRAVMLGETTDTLWNSWPVPALPGEQYTLTGRIRAENATGENYIQILFLGGPGWAWKGGPKSQNVTGSTDGWIEVSATGIVPLDADILRINLVSKGNTGRVLFDDLRLIRQ